MKIVDLRRLARLKKSELEARRLRITCFSKGFDQNKFRFGEPDQIKEI